MGPDDNRGRRCRVLFHPRFLSRCNKSVRVLNPLEMDVTKEESPRAPELGRLPASEAGNARRKTIMNLSTTTRQHRFSRPPK